VIGQLCCEIVPPVGASGEVTSACVSPTLGKTLALAYVRREVSEPGNKLNFPSGVTAEVIPLPFYQRPPTTAHKGVPGSRSWGLAVRCQVSGARCQMSRVGCPRG
jgi:hypothetical protein